jgi:hypothetical protein
MAVLQATECQAVANGEDHTVQWDYAAGRAIYTNRSADIEQIQPLGVTLRRGHTLAVTWMPGDTAYTLEIYRQGTHYAA